MKTINIYSGKYIYDALNNPNKICSCFNEAMCQGTTTAHIFDDEFIKQRAQSLNVDITYYQQTTIKHLQKFLEEKYDAYHFYFGSDMFCQLNLLTLLAYLGQSKEYFWHMVDETTMQIKKVIKLKPIAYDQLYLKTFITPAKIDKRCPYYLKQAIINYRNYQKPHSPICRFMRKHHASHDLISRTCAHFAKQYGLGDQQISQLFNQYIHEAA